MGFHHWMRRTLLIGALLALLAAACSSDGASVSSTSTAPSTSTTTTVPDTTTTTLDPYRCMEPWCVRYHIHPEAVWSDGTPVTGRDFVYTHELLTNPSTRADIGVGHEMISSLTEVDDKTLLVGFNEPYGPWRTLFPAVFPAHIGDPSDLSVTASAFRLDEVTVEGVTVGRNTNYWSEVDPLSGRPVGDVASIQFMLMPGVRDRVDALEDSEVDLIDPTPIDWIVEDVAEFEGVSSVVYPGPFWDHIDFNHADQMLSNLWVRRAIAMSLDREAILESTVRTIEPGAPALGNTIWMTQAWPYENHFDVSYNPEEAVAVLTENGCVLGDDDVYVCGGNRLSFVWASTIGDEFRETQAEIARDQLEDVGIELILDFRTPSELFSSEILFGGPDIWQIVNFSWRADADPHRANSTYYCEGNAPNGAGALNVNRYCNPEVEALIRSTNIEPDANARAASYNEADAMYLDDVAVIPLYQKAGFLAWNSMLSGPRPNISSEGATWNVASWAGLERVRYAIGSAPTDFDPLRTQTEDGALILSTLTSGAFGVNPDLDYLPVLVETAETVSEGG